MTKLNKFLLAVLILIVAGMIGKQAGEVCQKNQTTKEIMTLSTTMQRSIGYEKGYYEGMNDMLMYIIEHDYIPKDSIRIQLEWFIDRANKGIKEILEEKHKIIEPTKQEPITKTV
jgi:hypothetical protein